MKGNNS